LISYKSSSAKNFVADEITEEWLIGFLRVGRGPLS
jgi:hypothetical protein